MELTFEKKTQIGFQYVLDLLEPCSCFGSAFIRKLAPYAPDQRDELQTELDNIEKLISVLESSEKCITKLERGFMHLKDVLPIVNKCKASTLNEVELFEMKRFLLVLRDIVPAFQELSNHIELKGLEIKELLGALKIVDPDDTGVPSFYISETCSEDLRKIRREKKRIELLIRAGEGNADELSIERTKLAAKEEEAELAVKDSMSKQLRTYLDIMVYNVESICKLDVMLAKAKLAKKRSGCKPCITNDVISFESMRNPKIEDSLSEKDKSFTPISMLLNRGATVITGANMGGKSVALKTFALNVLLSICGIYPFAERAETVMLDSIYMVSEDLESVDRGLSSFGGEIMEFNTIIKRLNSKSLLLLDEFARGTNPDEGAAIVKASTKWLQDKEAFSLLTTHYDGVADLAGAHYQVIGLKNTDYVKLKQELSIEGFKNGVDRIAEHMNYGLYKVEEKQDCPKDALNICRLLDLEPEIISSAQNYY